jgi:hypothetical protein
LVAENMMSEQTKKTNLEENLVLGSQLHSHNKKPKAAKHHRKRKHNKHTKFTEAKKEAAPVSPVAPVVAVKVAQAPVVHAAPAAKSLLATKAVGQENFDKFAQ